MIEVQKIARTVQKISTLTAQFHSIVSNVLLDTSHMERDLQHVLVKKFYQYSEIWFFSCFLSLTRYNAQHIFNYI